ncbi:MAG: urease accessory protein UreF, partial [Cyanobium sp.]
MGTTMAPESRLRLLQLVSPALPVGAFSYSEGLEVLVQEGRLGDGAALGQWLRAELGRGTLTLETAALAELRQALNGWRQGDGPDQHLAVLELVGGPAVEIGLLQLRRADLQAQSGPGEGRRPGQLGAG